MISAADWDAAVERLRAADDVTLACHLNPDGDALGAMLALTLGLRSLGKRTFASFDSVPFRVPPLYEFLPGQELLSAPETFPRASDVLVTFDTGSVDRLGALTDAVAGARTVIVVDHHVTNTRYGHIHLVDSSAAASVVLVDELLRRLDVALTPEVAACLYTGLSTDTGSFKFQSTTPDVHAFAGRLLATGVDHAAIARAVWDTHRFATVKLLGALLERANLEREHALVWSYSTLDDFAAFGVGIEDIEGVIDVLRTTLEADVACVCKQGIDGRFRVSLRSKGATDVGAIAVKLGGGGHIYAAGYTSEDDLDSTVQRLREALDAATA